MTRKKHIMPSLLSMLIVGFLFALAPTNPVYAALVTYNSASGFAYEQLGRPGFNPAMQSSTRAVPTPPADLSLLTYYESSGPVGSAQTILDYTPGAVMDSFLLGGGLFVSHNSVFSQQGYMSITPTYGFTLDATGTVNLGATLNMLIDFSNGTTAESGQSARQQSTITLKNVTQNTMATYTFGNINTFITTDTTLNDSTSLSLAGIAGDQFTLAVDSRAYATVASHYNTNLFFGNGIDGRGLKLDLSVDPTPVPLPAAVFLFGPALGGLAILRKKRNVYDC